MNEELLVQGIRMAQKELVGEIDRICRANGLRYYLAYGTLIGAMRHNGFIPWDDDIDIMMPAHDMLRFAQLCGTELDTDRFFFQSPDTDKEYHLTINRLCRNNSVMLEKSMEDKNVHHGIFVDIYPLYGAAPTSVKRKIQIVQAMLRALYLLRKPVQNHGAFMKFCSKLLLALKSEKASDRYQRRLFDKISRYDFDHSKCVTVLDSGIKEMSTDYALEWFGNGVEHVFDDMSLMVPDSADSVLRRYFGDYMQLPPENERQFHHNFVKIELPKESQ